MWNPKYSIAFFGLNPGGDEYIEPSISSDDGSSYLCEDWGWGEGEAPLQKQVTELFKSISSYLYPQISHDDLMNGSLAANFIPFRSKDWAGLEEKNIILEFSRALWRERLKAVPTTLYITISKVSFNEIRRILMESGYQAAGNSIIDKVGWGNVTYQMDAFERVDHKSLLIRLPHLSRYRIFGRERSQIAINHFASVAAKYLSHI